MSRTSRTNKLAGRRDLAHANLIADPDFKQDQLTS
jgi:hypothetical protein